MRAQILIHLALAALLVLPATPGRAQDDGVIHLGVERSSIPRVRVRLMPLENAATAAGATDGLAAMASRLARDLYYSGLIDVVEPLPAGVKSPTPGGRKPREDENLAAPEYGLTLSLEGENPEALLWTVRLLEPSGDMRVGLRYNVALDNVAPPVHHFADEVVRQLTGEQGIAQTRIIFSRGGGEHRELFVVDYDGENLRQVTRNGSLNLTPRWSPDSKQIAYTSYEQGRQRLMLLDAGTGHSQRVGNFQGLNVGAAWSPTGKEMAVTLSRDGNSEIYRVRPDGRILARATFEPSIECSPAWDPSGQQIAFTSDRTGSPQIYVMDAVGANRRRVTFEGNYNDSAAWSPRSDRIAYVSRAAGLFTIFTVAPDGSELQQITFVHDRDNEDPSWAPDGRHLVVSSNRTGYTTLWIIDVDSGEARPLTRGQGIDTGPCWSGSPGTARASSAGDE